MTRGATPPRSRGTPAGGARGSRLAGLLLLACVVGACGSEAPAVTPGPARVRPLLLTQVPHGRLPARAAPRPTLIGGSRLVLDPGAEPAVPPRLLSAGLDAVGDVALHHDGKRVCFVGRAAPGDPAALYTTTTEGGAPRRLVTPLAPCSAPAWLPDGRIVYAAAVASRASAPGTKTTQALFVVGAGESAERITFGELQETSPAVLRDGRIVYVGWAANDETASDPGSLALLTVHPDGTGIALFHGAHAGIDLVRPRQGPDGTVYVIERDTRDGARVVAVDWRAPHEAARALEAPGDVLSIEPTPDGALLAVCVVPGEAATTVHLLHADGRAPESVRGADATWDVVHALEVAPRPRPQGHLSMMRRDKDYGTLLCMDGRPREAASRAVTARIQTWEPVEEEEPRPAEPRLRELGSTPLYPDGSFYVRVPPDLPLRVEILDADGAVLEATRTPFWVRPNEIRGCTGCHDAPDLTPPNRQPLAVQAEPVILRGHGHRESGR